MTEKKEATSTVVAKEQFVNARELHQSLQIKTRFNDWIERRIAEFGFLENEDYFTSFTQKRVNVVLLSPIIDDNNSSYTKPSDSEDSEGRPSKDYILTLDMAKELAMVEKSDVGRKVRLYFIGIEKQFRLLESKYRNFVEEKQDKIDSLLGRQDEAKTAFKDARNILTGIDREIKEARSITFHTWQDSQRIQQLPLQFEESANQ
jgi:anti-repressor protein